MSTLAFTDPRHVAAYIDRFEDRSIAPLEAYLWENYHSDAPTISRVRREELDVMAIDEENDKILIDAAIYTDHQKNDDFQNVLVLSHTQNPQQEKDNLWSAKVLVTLTNRIAADNLVKQIAGESALAFSVVE